MTGAELKAIRKTLNLTQREFGLALGYTPHGDVNAILSRLEAKERVSERTARLARIYVKHGIPERFD